MSKIFAIDSLRGDKIFYMKINEKEEKLLKVLVDMDCFEMTEVETLYDCEEREEKNES